MSSSIILCQPDEKKGCSICCGLFNHQNISKQHLSDFLFDGIKREREIKNYECCLESFEVRDKTSHICPYQAFLAENKPGCLLHPLFTGKDNRNRSLFSSSICDKFLCPAHEILSNEEKDTLIKAVDDWYLYSIAIADPYSFSEIYKICIKINQKINPSLINYGLMLHSKNLNEYRGPIFFYSLPEYNLNCMEFSLKYKDNWREQIFEKLLALSKKL